MNDDYKLYTSYESLIKKLENNGIEVYTKWLDENNIRVNTPIAMGKIMISSLCVAVQFHHIDLIKYIIDNGGDINGVMENCISHYTPLSAISLIDEYYIKYNKSRDNKQVKKVLMIKNEIFELLILNGADINLLGLNGKNLLGLELSKPLTHIIPKFIENIIKTGLNPNLNNFITNQEIPFSFDNKSWMAKRKILHFMIKNNQSLSIDLAWSIKPIVILLWSIIVTHIISEDNGKGDIFGLYLDISGVINFIKKLCPKPSKIIFIDDIQKEFKINNKDLIKKSVKIWNILIQNGTNLKEKQSTGKTVYETLSWFKNGNSILHSIFKKYKIKVLLNSIMKELNRNLHKILRKHTKKDIEKIRRIAEIFKISLKNKDLNDKIVRKNICNTIKFMKIHGKNIDSKFYNIILNLNDIYSNNEKILVGDNVIYYSKNEIISYPSNIIKGNKKQKIFHIFHISEIPELIRKGVNPYNREKFSKEILKEWYNKLSETDLQCTLQPVSLQEVYQFNFDELVLSRVPGTLITNQELDVYQFDNIPDINIRRLFITCYKQGLSLNSIINKISQKKNLGIKFINILNAKKYIKNKKKIVKVAKNITGYGIYDKNFNIKREFKMIERWVNFTSIGRYVDLINIFDKWTYPIIYNFFLILANYRQPIITVNNWKNLINNFWKKRKIYTLEQMNKFFKEIFFHIIVSGCNSGKLNLSFAIGIIQQLNSEFEMIENLKIFIIKNYDKNEIASIFKDLENQNIKLMGPNSIKSKYPVIINEIISLFNNDENIREIFSLGSTFDKQWDIIESENPGFEYYISTMKNYDRIFLEIQWEELLEDEKEPFIDAAELIQNNIQNKINKVWRDKIQDLLYLLTPHNGVYNVRHNYVIF